MSSQTDTTKRVNISSHIFDGDWKRQGESIVLRSKGDNGRLIFDDDDSGVVSAIGSASNGFDYAIEETTIHASPQSSVLFVETLINGWDYTMSLTNTGGRVTIEYLLISAPSPTTASPSGVTTATDSATLTNDSGTPTPTMSTTSQSPASTSAASVGNVTPVSGSSDPAISSPTSRASKSGAGSEPGTSSISSTGRTLSSLSGATEIGAQPSSSLGGSPSSTSGLQPPIVPDPTASTLSGTPHRRIYGGTIAGAVVGGTIFLILLILAALWWRRRCERQRSEAAMFRFDAMGPGIQDFMVKEKAEKASKTRYSLAPSAVSTLPEYGYASLDPPPPFSRRDTPTADTVVGPHDTVGTEEERTNYDSDTIPETIASHGRLTPNSRDALDGDVGHAM